MDDAAAMGRKAILVYFVTTIALGWAVQFGMLATFGDPEEATAPWIFLLMSTPALVAVAFVAARPQWRPLLRWRPTRRMWPMLVPALLIPAMIGFAMIALAQAMGWGDAGWFEFGGAGVNIGGGPWILGKGQQGWLLFAANVAVTAAAFALISAIPAIGEELGWRGFIQGPLIGHFGSWGGVILLGLGWSLWHLPALLAGYNYPEHPLIGAFLIYPVVSVGASFFLAWLTIRSGSFWPAALAHGAGNSIETGLAGNLELVVPQIQADILHAMVTLAVGAACLAFYEAGRARCDCRRPA